MIISFKHKGLERFFYKGFTKGLNADHVKKLRYILSVLESSPDIADIESVKPFSCHQLSGILKDRYAIWVNKNWRVTFKFYDGKVLDVNYEDYHDRKIRR